MVPFFFMKMKIKKEVLLKEEEKRLFIKAVNLHSYTECCQGSLILVLDFLASV
jgi:hypothetical protein